MFAILELLLVQGLDKRCVIVEKVPVLGEVVLVPNHIDFAVKIVTESRVQFVTRRAQRT